MTLFSFYKQSNDRNLSQKNFCSTEIMSRSSNADICRNLISKMALEEKSVAAPAMNGHLKTFKTNVLIKSFQ